MRLFKWVSWILFKSCLSELVSTVACKGNKEKVGVFTHHSTISPRVFYYSYFLERVLEHITLCCLFFSLSILSWVLDHITLLFVCLFFSSICHGSIYEFRFLETASAKLSTSSQPLSSLILYRWNKSTFHFFLCALLHVKCMKRCEISNWCRWAKHVKYSISLHIGGKDLFFGFSKVAKCLETKELHVLQICWSLDAKCLQLIYVILISLCVYLVTCIVIDMDIVGNMLGMMVKYFAN
jgi:hypothetical protein